MASIGKSTLSVLYQKVLIVEKPSVIKSLIERISWLIWEDVTQMIWTTFYSRNLDICSHWWLNNLSNGKNFRWFSCKPKLPANIGAIITNTNSIISRNAKSKLNFATYQYPLAPKVESPLPVAPLDFPWCAHIGKSASLQIIVSCCFCALWIESTKNKKILIKANAKNMKPKKNKKATQ